MIFIFLASLKIICDTEDSLVFSYSPEYSIYNEGDSLSIELKDGNIFTDIGEPALPFIKFNILVSENGAIMKYEVNNKEYIKGILKSNIDILSEHVKKDYKPVIFEPAKIEIYGNKVKTAEVYIFPFSFDGEKIEIRKEIIVKIYFRGKWYRPNYNIFVDFINQPKGERYFIRPRISKDDGLWIKMKIVKDGIYKIDRNFLQNNGINPDLIAPENVEIRTGYKNIFKFKNAFFDSLDTLPFKVPAIYNLFNENGKFDEGEYIMFFAKSLSGFERNFLDRFSDPYPVPGTDVNWWYYYNPFTDTNVYWIKTNGTRFEMEEKIINYGENTEKFLHTIHFEKDLDNPSRSGLTWIWNTITVPSDVNFFSYSFNIDDAIDSFCIVKMGIYCGISSTQHYSKLYLNGEAVNDTFFTPRYFYRERMTIVDTFYTLKNGNNDLKFEILNSKAIVYIDYIEITYWKNINSANNHFVNFSDSLNRLFSTNKKYILGIDDYYKPVNLKKTGNFFGYNGKNLFITDTFFYPIEAKISNVSSLWNSGADWICITSPIFKEEASLLAEHRRKNLNGFENPQVKVITVDEIYDNFSFGVRDPGAIKRFLLHTSTSWFPSPSFVFLFGKGTYDYKNLKSLSYPENFVPIHTCGPDIDLSSILASNPTVDVWFVDYDGNTRPDIPIGRVTLTTKIEAKQWVDKLIDFESSGGEWRNRVIILADDERVGGTVSGTELLYHTGYCEQIYNLLPKWFEVSKIYTILYPLEYGMKPSATNKFIEEFNKGAFFGYYLGHGNIYQLAHEKVLLMEDILKLKNWRKCPMFYFGTCNAGFFERPDERSIADYINIYPNGGTIVSIASTRATYAGANRVFGSNLVNSLLFKRTFGEVYTSAMNIYGDTGYIFFGDPATAVFKDTFNVLFNTPDTIIGGNPFNIVLENKFHKIYFSLSQPDTSISYTVSTTTVNFILEGKKIFNVNYQNKDTIMAIIPFDTKEGTGKARLHIYNLDSEFHGYKNIFLRKGLPSESIPPEIRIFSGNKELNENDYIANGSEIRIIINDESGIDIRRNENIVLFINDYSKPIYLGDKFNNYTGTFKSGEVIFPVSLENVDSFFIEVYCIDNCGNLGKKKLNLILRNDEYVWGIYNFPNPASNKTYFTFYLLNDTDVELSVYTVTGKKIWTKKQKCYTGFNKIEWKLIDDYGRDLPNGVYYYSIQIGRKKILKKMSIVR